jgi:hypothetical protein
VLGRNAGDALLASLTDGAAGLAVRLRAVRGLVEIGQVEPVRRVLAEMPEDEARRIVSESVPFLKRLAMAGSVPDGRLREPQIFAKDALVSFETWMTPDQAAETRAVVARWFLADPIDRHLRGDVPLARAHSAVRSAVAAGLSFARLRRWDEPPALVALAVAHGSEADRARLRGEGLARYVEAPYGTPRERSELNQGLLAALRTLGFDPSAAADRLAADIRNVDLPESRRVEAAAKYVSLDVPLAPAGLGAVAAAPGAPASLRAVLAPPLLSEGDPETAVSLAVDADPAFFGMIGTRLSRVTDRGNLRAFLDGLAACGERLTASAGRCDAVADALAAMGPNRAARAAKRLLADADPFVVSFAVAMLARIGTSDQVPDLERVRLSRDRSPCWPDRTIGESITEAAAAMAGRVAGERGADPGDDDDGG